MKRLFFATAVASALAFGLPTGVFAQQVAVPHGGSAHVVGPVPHAAVVRPVAPATVAPGNPIVYRRSVPFYGYYGPRFGFAGYDPFWYGWGYPGYGYGYYGAGLIGGLRLEIQPKTAQVFVDGYYAGVVDNFDGRFQQVNLMPGGHHVEVVQPGFETLTFDTFIQADRTSKYKGAMTPVAADNQ